MINMFSPQTILSNISKERCIANIKDFPSLIAGQNISRKVQASVLVPLCVINNEVCILYTLRSSNLKKHSGQVSFPGGMNDEGETSVEAALRETEEEIGILRRDIDIWTTMPQFQGRDKNIIITPVVGLIKNFNFENLTKNVNEVEEVFTVPMSQFCNTNNHAHTVYKTLHVPVFLYEKYKIWGITGFITHCFLQCLLPNDTYKVDFLRKRFDINELIQSKL